MNRVRNTTPELELRALQLRQEATPAEKLLWEALRAGRLDGHKFRRQHPLGRFILDFYCAKSRLCVEVDGEVHEKQRIRDMARDATLFSHGIVTRRFTNEQVFRDLPGVLDAIRTAATRPGW
ncbi:endonuclease domain-containing protein [Longimicrobium sp.]|uniref:endonuclease domain-containing protein n=1 Tax=Longimicrobium sp. TaxID=2029185 RepID=UPI003B3A4006